MLLPLIMTIAYLVITVIISVIIGMRGRGNSSNFLTAEGKLKWYFVAPLLFAEMVAGAATVGKAAGGFTLGLSATWVNWGMALGMLVFIVCAARFYRAMHKKYGAISIPLAFKHMFDQRSRMVMLIIVVVVYCFLYSSQPIAAAAVLAPMLNIDPLVIAWSVSALFIVATLVGGMKAVAVMNIVHALVMYVALTLVMLGGLEMVGGWEGLVAAVPASRFGLFEPNIGTTLANAIGISISFIAAATMVTGTVSARSPRDMSIGAWGAVLIIIPFSIMPALIGMCALALMPGIDPNTALFAMSFVQGPLLGGLISMAIVAAIISSAPSALLFSANVLTQDFLVLFKPKVTDKQKMIFSKLMIVVLALLSTWLGINAASILGQLYAAFQIRSVVGIVLLIAIIWPRVSATAAFWSMLGGGIIAAVWHFANSPFGLEPLWPACGFTIITIVVLSLLAKEKVSPGYRRYLEARNELARAEGRKEKKLKI